MRTYFPSPVVRVMRQDVFERLGRRRMLLEPEMPEAVEPDVLRKLAEPLHQAVFGSLNRAARHRRPCHNEIDCTPDPTLIHNGAIQSDRSSTRATQATSR
jgi:hypothetical protein